MGKLMNKLQAISRDCKGMQKGTYIRLPKASLQDVKCFGPWVGHAEQFQSSFTDGVGAYVCDGKDPTQTGISRYYPCYTIDNTSTEL